MIKGFTIITDEGDILDLDLFHPEANGILVDSVDGLGQVKADLRFSDMAGSNYSSLNSARLTKRNVVFKLLYINSDTEETETLVDHFFNTGEKVNIVVVTDNKELLLSGIVETNTPVIFSNEPDGAGAQISIMCPDPFMYELNEQVTVFDGIEPLFKFPFSDSNPDEIQFGTVRIIKDRSIYYTGQQETGITITVHALGIIKGLTIYNLDTNERIGIDDAAFAAITGSGIIKGDDIIISTHSGSKTVTLVRDGKTMNIINALVKNPRPDWFKLTTGDNLFTYTATEGEYHVAMNIKHRVLYKGI